MHDAGAVRVLEGLEDAVDVAHGIVDRHGAGRDDVLEERAVDELHHDVGNGSNGAVGTRLGVLAGIEDAHDRGMRHPRSGLRLHAETRAEGVVACEVAVEELDRDLAAERHVVAAVDRGHATATDELIDSVAPRKHARLSCHGHSLGGTESA